MCRWRETCILALGADLALLFVFTADDCSCVAVVAVGTVVAGVRAVYVQRVFLRDMP